MFFSKSIYILPWLPYQLLSKNQTLLQAMSDWKKAIFQSKLKIHSDVLIKLLRDDITFLKKR